MEIAAVNKMETVPMKFLGQLIWFSVTDVAITRDQLMEAFNKCGLNTDYLPRPVNPRNALRRLRHIAEIKRMPLAQGRRLNLLVREVRKDDVLMYHAVREIVDSKNVRLEYTPVAALTLVGDNLTVKMLDAVSEVERPAIQAIQSQWDQAKTRYNGQNVRDLIWRLLSATNPVAVRPSGGVYFIQEKYTDLVQKLRGFLMEVNKYRKHLDGRCEMWAVPVIDTEEQRQMVHRNLEDQIRNESLALIEDMTTIIKKGKKIRKTTAESFVQRIRELQRAVVEYEELLQMKQVQAKADLEVAQRQALELLASIDVEVE